MDIVDKAADVGCENHWEGGCEKRTEKPPKNGGFSVLFF